jgi:tRNA (adenine57-N1/adenine58-N1)-methyltransferase catalytic subunit
MVSGTPFAEGESCLLIDARGRQHLIRLADGGTFQFDKGAVHHGDLIGVGEGATIRSSNGTPLVAMRPRLADYVLNMKRGAAVLYPKDTGPIIVWGDIGPGNVVLEAGTGSGALTLALSRAVGPSGSVITVERREDHAVHAQRLIEAFAGATPDNIEFRIGEVVDAVATSAADRIVLDIPEPWTVVDAAAEHLPGGGIFVCYLPTIPQVQTVRTALDGSRMFRQVETFEVLMRGWTIDGASVRPDHRMVGHTGLITIARKRLPKRS